MYDYLDKYGVADARREKLLKKIVLTVLSLAIVSGALWFFLRNYREESQVREFLSLLGRKDYKSAYGMWGCTEASPCRDYKFDKFLQDWGPQSDAADASSIERLKVKSCDTGIIQQLKVKGQDINLYVDRSTLVLGFSPWPVCNPRVKV